MITAVDFMGRFTASGRMADTQIPRLLPVRVQVIFG